MEQQAAGLLEGRSGLRPNDFAPAADLATWIGRVSAVEDVRLPGELAAFDCRQNRLVELALSGGDLLERVEDARDAYGADRIGVYFGTSTSGILECELAYLEAGAEGPLPDYRYATTHNLDASAQYLRARLALRGPGATISTACSSSAKAFAAAQRAVQAGLCDAALVGGADSLCLTTLYGFNSLELLSAGPCRPFAAGRDGISIGEAAGLVLLTREQGEVRLAGYGESSDAHHMSSPHPQGEGAAAAMRAALDRAGRAPETVGYLHLHGTGTASNDPAEARAVRRVFRDPPPAASTKAFTGHTLGAAGVTAAILSALMIERGFVAGLGHGAPLDEALGLALLARAEPRRVDSILSNSLGFGGSNCSLLLERAG